LGGSQTNTTTTTGTQSTTVIGGGGSPQVTISASTIDNAGTSSPSGTSAAPTPQADPIGDTVRQVVNLWDETAQMIAGQAARPSAVPDAVGERAVAPPPTTVPAPTAVVADTAPAADLQPSVPAAGDPLSAPVIKMLTTLASTGAAQIGVLPMSLATPTDAEAVMAARFAEDVPTLDFPEPGQARIPDKSLWTIPGRSSAEKIMMAATFLVAVSVLAALVISYARHRALRMPSGIWRAAGS
jgi:hypothetical protein